jgi:hypothetical protein
VSNVPPPPPPGYGDGQNAPPFGAQPPGYGAPPPYAHQGYGAPGYGGPGYPANQREHPAGTTVLVLGILGLVIGFGCGLGFIMSPIAWAKGNTAKREMEAEAGVYWTNKGNITAGRICGIIGTCILIFGVVSVVVIIAVAASSA